MEPHAGKPTSGSSIPFNKLPTIMEFYRVAMSYACMYHKPTLTMLRQLNIKDLTQETFWSEYIWCVYTSGFNAKVVTKLYPGLYSAYGPSDSVKSAAEMYRDAMAVFSNDRKSRSVIQVKQLLQALGWERFMREYLDSPESMQRLPYVGRITCYHLARNLGMDCVKPDLHLVRLAKHYACSSPLEMCRHIQRHTNERLGVIDFVLWAYSAAYGTSELEHASLSATS